MENSKYFKDAKKKAEKLLKNKTDLEKLLKKTWKKTAGNKKVLCKIWDDIQLLFRMLKAWKNKEYTVVPWRTLIPGVGFLIYLLNPIDLVPDFIPLLGLLDDIALGIIIFKSIRMDMEDFRRWEEEQYINID